MFCTKIELLSPDILTKYPEWLNDLDFLSAGLFKEFGWHYPVDIVWILSELERLGLKKGSTILDAGAGNGILQLSRVTTSHKEFSAHWVSTGLPAELATMPKSLLAGEEKARVCALAPELVQTTFKSLTTIDVPVEPVVGKVIVSLETAVSA